MADQFRVGSLYSPQIHPKAVNKAQTYARRNETSSFENLLNQQLLKFSHHAEMRLEQRGIEIPPEQMEKLEAAVNKAAQKGAKETLLLMDQMAFIVNVKNQTVVTAMDQTALKDHIFTQIDSAMIVQ
ncbi:TIGR02530 family flagellar biosynthesis protein [Marinicrinis lubricantis]|uniref:TIGR02530 family flagellar biosynthesis protein n=1 Tax=Marinicrinis lubricantis TaxID=2086470 RepID=A0ABW1IMI4_9BACL